MRSTHLLPLLCGVLASAVGSLAACGVVAPTPIPDPEPVAPVDAGPATREAPSQLSASTNLADLVRLTWSPPVNRAGLSGYRLFRDGKVLALVPASDTSFEDRTAVAATLLPPLLTVSDGTRETGIEVSWKPVGTGGVIALQSYAVVAMYGAEESVRSLPAQGSRAGIVTGYEVSQDGGPWTPVPKGELRFEDTNAPRAKVSFPTPKVENDFSRSAVRLELEEHPVVGPMPSRTYRVRALSATDEGDPSLPATGKRASVPGDRIPVQWQRSATSADGSYADIPGVTGRVWLDSTAPTNESRFFRARVAAPWAEGTSTANPGRATAWSGVASNGGACGLVAADGAIRCWGSYLPASYGPNYLSVAGSSLVDCGIRASDRRLSCAGDNRFGVVSHPNDPMRSVSIHRLRGCGLRASDSSLVCWGWVPEWLDAVEAALPYERVAAGANRVCAIRQSDHRIKCWGGEWTVPNDAFVRVSVGDEHVCGIRQADGKLQCWGRLKEGSPAPGTATPTVTSYAELESNGMRMCAIRAADRQIECWGPLDEAPTSRISHPPLGRFNAVNVGEDDGATAVREDGRLVRWGAQPWSDPNDSEGVLSSISLGFEHGCGLRTDGKLSCWPKGASGLDENVVYKAVAAHSFSTCALRASDGRAVCNAYFGTVSVTDSLDAISVYSGRACGVRSSDKKVVCWGFDSGTPQVLPNDAFLSIAISLTHGCGIRAADRKLVCWGESERGGAPPGPSTLAYKAVAANHGGTCAIREVDGLLDCWGWAAVYSAGLPRVAYKSLSGASPICAIRASDDRIVCDSSFFLNARWDMDPFLAVSASGQSACGIRASDRKLVCWGDDAHGEAPRP